MCDGATDLEMALNLAERVDQYGYTLQGVEGPGGWMYTIGLTDRGHPELVFVGDCQACAVGCLTELSEGVLAGDRLEAGEVIVLENGFEARLVSVHAAQIRAGLVGCWYRYQEWRGRTAAGPPVLQVLLSSHPEIRTRLDRPAPLLSGGFEPPHRRRSPSKKPRKRRR